MKIVRKLLAVLCTTIFASSPIDLMAMDFSVVTLDGRVVLLAQGPIEIGDAPKYRAALNQIPVQPHGARVVVLDSPGGSVNEALGMNAVDLGYAARLENGLAVVQGVEIVKYSD